MEFDKIVFADNLSRLIQQTGRKISDVEKDLGVSVGFISRLGKADSKYNVNAETLCKAAELFGVSMDSLVRKADQTEATNEAYIFDFVSKVLAQTDGGKLEWKRISLDELEGMFDDAITVRFPIYNFVGKGYKGLYPSDEEIYRFGVARSRCGAGTRKYFTATGAEASPQGDVFSVKLNWQHTLYLLRSNIYVDPIDDVNFFFELCFVDTERFEDMYGTAHSMVDLPKRLELPGAVTPICNTLQMDTTSAAYQKIRELYTTVNSLFGHNRVSKDARSIIDMFMLDQLKDEPVAEDSPVYEQIDDDDLPF